MNLHVVLFIHDDESSDEGAGASARIHTWIAIAIMITSYFRIMATNREISICKFQLKSIEQK